MPVIKELQDIVKALGEHDEKYQKWAAGKLLHILEYAEQDVADSHLADTERWQERLARRVLWYERRYGKAAADELRAQIEEIKRL